MTDMNMIIKLALKTPGVSSYAVTAKSIGDLSLMIPRHQMMYFFKQAIPYLSIEDRGEYLHNCWTMMDGTSFNRYFSRTKLVQIFREAGPENVMGKDDLDFYKRLPTKMEIYRGLNKNNLYSLKGLSWTLDPKTAKWFTGRPRKGGKVFRATIQKKFVLAYYNNRDEQEVVVDFRRLQDIELVK